MGTLCQDGTLEFGTLDWAQYIKVKDESQISSNRFGGTADGFDVDAITVLGSCGISARFAVVEEVETTVPDEDAQMVVYPNPAEDFFMVDLSGLIEAETATINVFDASGRIIFNEAVVVSQGLWTKRFSLDGLAKGVYTIRLENKTGVWTERLVK